jgi:RNA polymerase sigma factor for flagellar operon FliA
LTTADLEPEILVETRLDLDLIELSEATLDLDPVDLAEITGESDPIPFPAIAIPFEAVADLAPDMSDAALTRIVQDYMPLVRHAVNRVVAGATNSSILGYEDMLSCGVQGLIEAYRAYDPTRGAKFSTYALPRIRGSILDALRAAHPLPRSLQKVSSDIEKASASLYTDLGRSPTKEELAKRMGLEVGELLAAAKASSIKVVSLESLADMTVNGATEKLTEMADDDPGIDPDVVAQREILRHRLLAAVDELPDRERRIIRLYYIEARSLKSIGRSMEISESRASQLRHRAIRRLRTALARDLAEAA